MAARTGSAHVVTTTRKYKDRIYRTHLLRRSYREDGVVKNETLGNLSHLPEPLIEIIRRSLQGESFVPVAQALEITQSRAHGQVQAVAAAMQRLDLATVIASKPSRERDLVLAMVARAHHRSAHQAGHHALVADHNAGRGLRRGWCERGRSVCGDGLVAGAPGHDPEEAGGAPSAGGQPGAVRPVVELLRGQHLSAGQAWLQPRWQERACCRSTTACSPMPAAARWRCRSTKAMSADSQTLLPEVEASARAVRRRATGDGRRPRHDFQPGHRRRCRIRPGWTGSPP